MQINSPTVLFMELEKIRNAIMKEEKTKIRKYYEEYNSMLRVPKEEVTHYKWLKIYSEKVSYYILSLSVLLFTIDYHWDGENFRYSPEKEPFLFKEMNVRKTEKEYDTKSIKEILKNVTKYNFNNQLTVFLFPYQYKEDVVFLDTMPEKILIIYNNEIHPDMLNLKVVDKLFDFYLQIELKNKIPKNLDKKNLRQEFYKNMGVTNWEEQ